MQVLKRNDTEASEKALLTVLQKARAAAPDDYAGLHIRPLPAQETSIACFEYGDPEGRPLVCLHGLSVSGKFFEQYDDYFSQLGVRAIAPCLLGGVYLPDSTATIETLVNRLLELLNVLGIEKFDVMGFSWGTVVELALLSRVPDRIRKAGFLGAMTPLDFAQADQLRHLKSDVRLSLNMVKFLPWVHRGLMSLFCRMPPAKMMEQFKDDKLSAPERLALAPGSAFAHHFVACFTECIRTGSQFLTDGWRMFLDEPSYTLNDLARGASAVDLRLYVAEHDNVHLPHFSAVIAAACSGEGIDQLERTMARAWVGQADPEVPGLERYSIHGPCSVWYLPGAGRLACVLYFREALANLLSPQLQQSPGEAQWPRIVSEAGS
jgi:pimeloyl-ACP methyl ester carboxylesterase